MWGWIALASLVLAVIVLWWLGPDWVIDNLGPKEARGGKSLHRF